MLAIHAAETIALAPMLAGSATSLAGQSRCDRGGENHRDGWGLGWYDDAGRHVQLGAVAACDDPEFAAVAERLTARIALAHVRDASVGTVRLENCHPFSFGPWLFCHNGTIEGFDRLRPSFERETLSELAATRRGDTDSEHLFLWILSNAVREGLIGLDGANVAASSRADVEGMYGVVRESLRRLLGWCAALDVPPPTGLCLFLTDGRWLLAVRHGRSLSWRSAEATAAAAAHTVIASEPLDDSHDWREVTDPSILTIDAAGRVATRPF